MGRAASPFAAAVASTANPADAPVENELKKSEPKKSLLTSLPRS